MAQVNIGEDAGNIILSAFMKAIVIAGAQHDTIRVLAGEEEISKEDRAAILEIATTGYKYWQEELKAVLSAINGVPAGGFKPETEPEGQSLSTGLYL